MKTEILFGIHPVFEALRAARRNFFEIYIAKENALKRFEKMVAADSESYSIGQQLKQISVKNIQASELKSMAATEFHQGIGAKVSPYPLTDLSDILGSAESNPFLLLLDNVVDTHNLGALVRTGLCVGTHGIIIPKDRSALPTPAVSKASAGALEHVFLARVTNLVNTIKELRKKGVWIAGMDKSGDHSVFASDLTCPIGIVIGGEEKGLRPLVKKHCDFLMSIPQKGPVNSLNASVAGAVTMYEAFRQRGI
ncbi:23S rRNA (guanosine-2'-O-)-methyltransferase [Desulfonema magnum]|uniref:23S rRNA (Guanosine-2'-O-)-methyltransferase n=2 Tax=Desulfonema magnum TaxID=45655 RepID=A0A975BUK0_9BACT|nr:23S rRNA (guanosine-2'-O-)-methyltransferase [Desulfonema magnum]